MFEKNYLFGPDGDSSIRGREFLHNQSNLLGTTSSRRKEGITPNQAHVLATTTFSGQVANLISNKDNNEKPKKLSTKTNNKTAKENLQQRKGGRFLRTMPLNGGKFNHNRKISQLKCNPYMKLDPSRTLVDRTDKPIEWVTHRRGQSTVPTGDDKNKKSTRKVHHVKNKTSVNFYTKVPLPAGLLSKPKSTKLIQNAFKKSRSRSASPVGTLQKRDRLTKQKSRRN